jgi:hypothetical protein
MGHFARIPSSPSHSSSARVDAFWKHQRKRGLLYTRFQRSALRVSGSSVDASRSIADTTAFYIYALSILSSSSDEDEGEQVTTPLTFDASAVKDAIKRHLQAYVVSLSLMS